MLLPPAEDLVGHEFYEAFRSSRNIALDRSNNADEVGISLTITVAPELVARWRSESAPEIDWDASAAEWLN